jgi:hypothetical protein
VGNSDPRPVDKHQDHQLRRYFDRHEKHSIAADPGYAACLPSARWLPMRPRGLQRPKEYGWHASDDLVWVEGSNELNEGQAPQHPAGHSKREGIHSTEGHR